MPMIDLADIYADVMDGLGAGKECRYPGAIWQWRFPYWMHRGRHAVHMQTRVYADLADGNWPNNAGMVQQQCLEKKQVFKLFSLRTCT